jgi:hypothetical protein
MPFFQHVMECSIRSQFSPQFVAEKQRRNIHDREITCITNENQAFLSQFTTEDAKSYAFVNMSSLRIVNNTSPKKNFIPDVSEANIY